MTPPGPPGGAQHPRDLVLLCGLAFSGKSTLAEAIVRQLGGSIVSLDEINARRGLWGGDGIPRGEWAKTHQTAVAAIEERMRRGVSPIVVDDTHCFRFLRDHHRELGRRHGYREILVVLDTPFEVMQRRREENRWSGRRPAIRDELWQEHRRSFEWPSADEPHLVFSAGTAIAPWIKRYLAPPGPAPEATGERGW